MAGRLLVRPLVRRFYLHEHQSKGLMAKYGLRVQQGGAAPTPAKAREIASILPPGELIVKAQVLAGGRGKGRLTSGLQGGVQFCTSAKEVEAKASQMIGFNLITKQTTSEGVPVNGVLVYHAVDIQKQLYLAMVLDRKHNGPVVVASKQGGVDIEETAAQSPDSIYIRPIDIRNGLTPVDAAEVATRMELTQAETKQCTDQLQKMYKMFIEKDATQIEINPWAITPKGDLVCVDAKVNIDDSALFRQPEVRLFKEEAERSAEANAIENRAERASLNYVALDGNIGCLVNGAGLAMATMDLVKQMGGTPANFLDVGGGASVEQVKEAFHILGGHPQVKAIFVNIFGGILLCDRIANGLVQAARDVGLRQPLVVRLEGTNADLGRKILAQAGSQWNLNVAEDMESGAKLAVKLANSAS